MDPKTLKTAHSLVELILMNSHNAEDVDRYARKLKHLLPPAVPIPRDKRSAKCPTCGVAAGHWCVNRQGQPITNVHRRRLERVAQLEAKRR